MPKYVLDTNIFIDAFRSTVANQQLQRFHLLFAPFEYLSAVVSQELMAGTRNANVRRKLERHLLTVYARRGRVLTPSQRTWERSGLVLAELAGRDGLDLSRVTKSLGNDILLALSCRESGCTLITDNERDFKRIDRLAPFRFLIGLEAALEN